MDVGEAPGEGLAAMTRCDFEVAEKAMRELIEHDIVSLDGYTLSLVNFDPAQKMRTSARIRKQMQRDRDTESQDVTDGHSESPDVLKRREEKRIEKKRVDDTPKPPRGSRSRATRGTTMSDGWTPKECCKAMANELNLVVDDEADDFRDWTAAKRMLYVDWDRAFHSHLRKASQRPKPYRKPFGEQSHESLTASQRAEAKRLRADRRRRERQHTEAVERDAMDTGKCVNDLLAHIGTGDA